MSSETDQPTADACAFCGSAVRRPTTDDQGTVFCSTGCQSVRATLGESIPHDSSTAATERESAHTNRHADDVEELFVRVEGMHSVTCEQFIEQTAESCAGVLAAEASYVAEILRVDYRPTEISVGDLCDELSVVGYTAVPRDAAPIDSSAATEQRDRGLDTMLGYRYAVGVLFGSFLLLTYIVLFYPIYLSELLGTDTLQLFAGGGSFANGSGLLILPLYLVLTGIVLFFTGMPLLRGAYVSLTVRRPNTELLVAIPIIAAYLYSTVAIFLGQMTVYYDLTFVIVAAVVAAIFYESLVKRRAMDRLTDLTIAQIDEASLLQSDGTTESVSVDSLTVGDRVLVQQGDRIPVDGVLDNGTCTVDEAVITGESLPVSKQSGDPVVGGTVVRDDAAVVRVTDGDRSSIDRLISAVWEQQSGEHSGQRQANRVATVALPLLVGGALLTGIGLTVTGAGPLAALLGSLAVFIVASPWGLGLATPVTVATTLTDALQRGIVIFDETLFERLRAIDVVVFDKTGTLTTGDMRVLSADAPPELLEAVAALEQRAAHPVADAITNAFGPDHPDTVTDGGVDPADAADQTDGRADSVTELTTHDNGVEGIVDGQRTLVGHPALFEARGWQLPDEIRSTVTTARERGHLPVVVGRDGQAAGVIVVGDQPRDGWEDVMARLQSHGIETVVLTGDERAAADSFAQHDTVDHLFAGVPPAGKTATIRALQAERSVAMIGDGTNDAPALAQADLGIALGSGTALAADAADITIVDDDLGSLETALDLAQAAKRRTRQNNALALVYNGIAIPAAVAGVLNPVVTMVAVLTVCGLVAGNASRSLR